MNQMNRNPKLVSLLLVLSLAVFGCSNKESMTQADESSPVPVQVESVSEGTVREEAEINGKLAPREEVKISPKVSAKIAKIYVSLGQQVNQGDILFTLDSTDLANQVKQSQAAYELALANLKQAQESSEQGIEQAKGGLVQAENAVVQAENALQDAAKHEQRMAQLFKEGAIPAAEYEKAQTALKSAEISLKNAQTAYDHAKNNVQHAEKMTGVDVAKASVNQARVNLDNARSQLANVTVKAPISGVVAAISGSVGEIASPQMPVVTIVNINPLVAKVNLSEQEITRVKVGTKTSVDIPALQREVEATVSAVSPVMDQQLKAYPIEIEIPNPSNELKADMVVKVKLSGDQENLEKTLIVPRKAVVEEQGKLYVYKLEGDSVRKTEIVSGAQSSEHMEVKSGLSLNDRIVVKGQTLLHDGDKVEIQPSH